MGIHVFSFIHLFIYCFIEKDSLALFTYECIPTFSRMVSVL